jgi:hypothetical protein
MSTGKTLSLPVFFSMLQPECDLQNTALISLVKNLQWIPCSSNQNQNLSMMRLTQPGQLCLPFQYHLTVLSAALFSLPGAFAACPNLFPLSSLFCLLNPTYPSCLSLTIPSLGTFPHKPSQVNFPYHLSQ